MTLADLIAGIAGQLGNTWRMQYRNNQPVIIGPLGWLIFGQSPEAPMLRIVLLDNAAIEYDLAHRFVDVIPGCGIGETSQRIHTSLLAPARAFDSERGARTLWHNRWCARLTAWGVQSDMLTQITADVHAGLVLGVRAQFYPGIHHAPPLMRNTWGAITVFYDGFPARVEYFTTEEAIRERIDTVAGRVEPGRRGLLRRKQRGGACEQADRGLRTR